MEKIYAHYLWDQWGCEAKNTANKKKRQTAKELYRERDCSTSTRKLIDSLLTGPSSIDCCVRSFLGVLHWSPHSTAAMCYWYTTDFAFILYVSNISRGYEVVLYTLHMTYISIYSACALSKCFCGKNLWSCMGNVSLLEAYYLCTSWPTQNCFFCCCSCCFTSPDCICVYVRSQLEIQTGAV